jgi:predicted transcriptional regulator
MIQETSLISYRTEILPSLSERQRAVYNLLFSRPNMTNKEIARYFNCDACSITGRIKELRDLQLVTDDCQRPCKITNRTAIAWRLTRNTLF